MRPYMILQSGQGFKASATTPTHDSDDSYFCVYSLCPSTAWAAANLAIGTRYGDAET